MQQRANRPFFKEILFILVSVVGAVTFSVYLFDNTIYPDSALIDTFGHFFKINYLHDSLKNGVWYPVYTEYWYNSIELFRYWPPFSYYVVALIQFLVGGDVLDAYFVFAGVVYFINMMGWLLFGKRENRLGFAFVLGNLFFFCPDNIRVFLAEGNIPRIFIASLLPYAFYYTWEILHYKNYKRLINLGIVTWVITLSHYMIAAMTGISIFIFCAVYSIMNKQWRQIVYITIDLGLAYITMGIGLIPGLLGGGLTSQSSEASVSTISQWAQEAVKSLNPLFRVDGGAISSFYFGLVIFIIALLGTIAADKKMGPGFITTLFIFLSTTTVASSVVRLLPMSQVFWMQRFVPMAMCIFFLSLLVWKKLKRGAIIAFVLLMLIDTIGEAALLIKPKERSIKEEVEQEVSLYLLPKAKELTRNRLGILDYSLWGSIPSWYLTSDMDESNVQYSFGWAYQGAETMENIVTINEAAEGAFYEYAFDRLLELGDDVVLVDRKQFPTEHRDSILAAAKKVGYTLYEENDEAWLLYIEDVNGEFGIIKQYDNLAIGSNAHEICYIYPDFGWGNSSVLEDYGLEELKQYDKIYLSGFTYRDKETAEALLTDAANSGVKIYIDMQHIPLNKLSGKAEFLDVYAQFVAFTEKFPVLATNNSSQFKLDFKTAGYKTWNTVYITGASERIKEAYYDNATKLTYVATNGNSNITFLGFNPVYYYHESMIPELLVFLNEVFEEEYGNVCESHIVPIDVTYEANKVTVTSDKDEVITGISNLDCFELADGSDKTSLHNMLQVNSGTTVYNVKYPHFTLGMAVSVTGLLGSIIYWFLILRKRKEGDKDEEIITDSDVCISVCDAGSCDRAE